MSGTARQAWGGRWKFQEEERGNSRSGTREETNAKTFGGRGRLLWKRDGDGDGDGEKSVRLNEWSKTGPGSTAWRGRHSDMQMNNMRRIADAEGKCWTRFGRLGRLGRFERRVTVHDAD